LAKGHWWFHSGGVCRVPSTCAQEDEPRLIVLLEQEILA
jgi:hypothetical protein